MGSASKKVMKAANVLLLSTLVAASIACGQVDVKDLRAPAGFHVSLFADTKGHPRMMAWSPGGALLATSTSDGTVLALPDPNGTGKAQRVAIVLADLDGPHGIAFHEGKLYVAEVDQVVRYEWDEKGLRASNPKVIIRLPGSGGGHMTRTLLLANGKLYVSAGSSCNVCVEKDAHRAAVMQYNPDGSGERIFARGMRNAVGLALSPQTRTVWTTENGRDWLGDDLPPDEINDLGADGGDFGWPYCYGDRVPDLKFAGDAGQRCGATVPARVNLQAHSAPLGLAFQEGPMFPGEYRGNLFVAFHGSWNRSAPTGYKVVRIPLDKDGKPGRVEDFITGWLPAGERRKGTWKGRPVGVIFGRDGSMYISDDASGAIYRVTYGK